MTLDDDNGQEFGGDEILAAEYVLGVLPDDERRVVSERIDHDADFARLVDEWEVHFAPMAAAYQPVEAPAAVKRAIDGRLFSGGRADAARTKKAGIWTSLNFWRGLAAAAILSHAISVAVPYFLPSGGAPSTQFVASLAAEGSDVRYLALYDPQHQDVGMSHVSGERGAGKDFELWMIEGDKPPVSLGVIPVGPAVHIAVARDLRARLEAGAVLAVSVEPAGGSPTGQPTGPVVAAGDLKTI
jgi:anti-sigma-K factor RskA